jgi:hypothetical protein
VSSYTPDPIIEANGCASVADPKRLRRAINIGNGGNYDAHISADELRRTLGPHASQWGDRIDDCIEWLSVVRDGLRGMDGDERVRASIARCGVRPGATSHSQGIQGISASIADSCESLTDKQVMEALGAARPAAVK